MAVDFLGAFGVGSGVDSKSLVESLVAAERAPTESRLNTKISQSETQISAYGTVLSALELLETAFDDLNDASDFENFTSTVSGGLTAAGTASFSATTTSDAASGSYEVSVTSLAERDRWFSSGYDATTSILNDGNDFTLTFSKADGSTQTVSVTGATPSGVVSAINAADIGISASLIDTGADTSQYKISMVGSLGEDNAFTMTDDIAGGTTGITLAQSTTAADSSFTVDGVAVTRSTNTVDDLLDGVTLNLLSAPSASAGSLSVEVSTDDVEAKIRMLVETYNTIHTAFDALTDLDSSEELGGSLNGDNTFRTIENQLRDMFTNMSSTPGSNLSYLSDIGIEMTRYGTLEIDEEELADALASNYSDVKTMLSADTENQSQSGDASRGIAGDALFTLRYLMDTDGPIRTRTDMATTRIADYEADLADLELRMEQVYQRYLKQFTAMETIVDQMNSTRDFLEQQIDALPFNNKNN